MGWPLHTPPTLAPYGGFDSARGMVASGMPGAQSPVPELHPLFDSQSTNYPHSALMPAYLYAFFQTYGGAYTFLNYEESMQKHVSSTLNPLLANVMAAMAIP
jgi:hypothetical protein